MTASEFRALALLRTVVVYMRANKRPPVQHELVEQTSDGWGGLLNDWFDESGARADYPFGFVGGPHVDKAAKMLSEAGLLAPRGYITQKTRGALEGQRRGYEPTAEGLTLGKKLARTKWQNWKSVWLKMVEES